MSSHTRSRPAQLVHVDTVFSATATDEQAIVLDSDGIGNAPTSQIAYEVVESHFALGFDVGRVHVGVEENHGEGQDEDSVRVVKLLHHVWIAHAVSLAAEGENVQQY